VPGFAAIVAVPAAVATGAALLSLTRRRYTQLEALNAGLRADLERSAEAQRRLADHATTLEAVGAAIRRIGADEHPRAAVCRACCTVAGADTALLIEPDGDGGLAVTGASDGLPGPTLPLQDGASPGAMLLRASESLYAPQASRHPLVAPELLDRLAVSSLLLQPVTRGRETVGALLVGWHETLPAPPPRAALGLPVLAGEASVAIERADLMAQLRDLSLTDPLTGLANRRAWDADLDRALAQCARHGFALTVAMADLDHFKRFNDLHGHRSGDRLLRELAAAWQGSTRREDLLARWGGERFVLAMPACDLEQARVVAARLVGAIPGDETCSIGLAMWDRQESAQQLLARADERLHAAKARGRARICI